MNHREYVAQRVARDPEFRAAREASRPRYEFQRALIAARLAAGLTQRQLAERMETTQSAIARIEGGEHPPRLDTLQRWAAACQADFTIKANAPLDVRPRARRSPKTTARASGRSAPASAVAVKAR
jgi:transcriptional regulator with XRE-family HTH domain